MKSLFTAIAASAILLSAAAIAQSAPAHDPSVNIRLDRLERLLQPSAAPTKAADSPDVLTLTDRSGTFIFNFTIQLSTPVTGSGDSVYCYVSLQVNDSATSTYFEESGEAYATISGGTAHCTVKVPYAWVLGSAGPDTVTGYYDVTEYTGSATGMTERTNSHSFAPIPMPANGAVTSFGYLPRL